MLKRVTLPISIAHSNYSICLIALTMLNTISFVARDIVGCGETIIYAVGCLDDLQNEIVETIQVENEVMELRKQINQLQ